MVMKNKSNVHVKKHTNSFHISFGIRKKLLVSFVIPIIFLIILGRISYEQSSEGLRSANEAATQQSFGAVANHLAFAFETIQATSLNYSFDSNVQNYASKTVQTDSYEYSIYSKTIETSFETNKSSNNFIQDIILLTSSDKFIIYDDKNTTRKNGFYEDYKEVRRISKGCSRLLDNLTSSRR